MQLRSRFHSIIRGAACVPAMLLSVAAISPAASASECQSIVFLPGAVSANIRETVQPDELQCFRFATRRGQTVRLRLTSKSGNVAMSIDGVADNRERIEFTSEKKTYELVVHQTLRSVSPDEYTLSVAIE